MNSEWRYKINRFFMWINGALALIMAFSGDATCFLNAGVAFYCWFASEQSKKSETEE